MLFSKVAALAFGVSLLASPALAQTDAVIRGVIVDPQGLALPGVSVAVFAMPTRRLVQSAVSNTDGTFVVRGLPPGPYLVSARLEGFQTREQSVTASTSGPVLRVALPVAGFEQQVVVTAQMPEVSLASTVSGAQMERRAAQDVAGYLRSEPGVGAVRRGAINLEPTVRGLYEAQMGVFVDGTRTFAAGPARMDSEISHVSPHMLESLEVVKGPYALTAGSGTLSSLQARTFRPAFSGSSLRVHGRGSFDFVGNGTAPDAFGGLWASTDRVRFTLLHNTRVGHDYTDGHGATVQGDYQSYDTRWDLGVRPTPALRVEYEGGYQDQEGLDYPGRILNAVFFRTSSHSGEVSWRPSHAFVTEVFGQVYSNRKHHLMTNDGKPTAEPMPGRVPPFALAIAVPTISNTAGGSGYIAWRHGSWDGKIGGDVYRLAQDATRSIHRRDTGALLFEDVVWPDAHLTNGGGYGQAVYHRGPARVGGTLRVDAFNATAGTPSDFFLAHTSGALAHHDADVSAAVNASLMVTPTWTLTIGAGRAVRAPDVLERYSDRFPAAQFQIAAEFMGNPDLAPEKGLELNAGSTLQWRRTTLTGDAFYRTIDDYITVMPDPTLPERLPLSPPLVYRYVNGSQARFTGFEASATSAVHPSVDVRANWSYLRAEDETFHEPVFGIEPFHQQYVIDLHTPNRASWAEIAATIASAQHRVAVARLEQPTAGWTTVDVRGGMPLRGGLVLRAGIDNLANRAYAEHLNAPDPFTGERVLEKGRTGYLGAEYTF